MEIIMQEEDIFPMENLFFLSMETMEIFRSQQKNFPVDILRP